jgi:CRISPR-associated protein Cas1
MFTISSGENAQKVAVQKVRNIYINRSALLTADVLFTAVENNIAVIMLKKEGGPYGRIWSAKYGSISLIRKKQLAFSSSTEATNWINTVLIQKIKNQQILLYMFDSPNANNVIETTLNRLNKSIKRLTKIEHLSMKQYQAKAMGIEGAASREYFRCVSSQLSLPFRFERRSQHPAKDMFNSLLNYSYGILYSKIEGELIKAGLDPYVGILHRDDYNKPVLVYDVIELYRVWADAVVIRLCQQGVIFPEFFDSENEGLWLNNQGKKILVTAFTDYLNEVIDLRGSRATRINHIGKYCKDFALGIKEEKTADICFT